MEKGSGGFRLVLDLKFLNKYFDFPKVKFENLTVLKHASPQVKYATSIDISDAYHHLRVADSIKCYFQFKINGEYFIAVGLPFGWAPAPGVFTKFVRQALNAMRYPGKIQD